MANWGVPGRIIRPGQVIKDLRDWLLENKYVKIFTSQEAIINAFNRMEEYPYGEQPYVDVIVEGGPNIIHSKYGYHNTEWVTFVEQPTIRLIDIIELKIISKDAADLIESIMSLCNSLDFEEN